VRAKILAAQELHRMRGDDGQCELRGETHGRSDEWVVVRMARSLHFEIVPIREKHRPGLRRLECPGRVALRQRG
jgi:hypothetical protein